MSGSNGHGKVIALDHLLAEGQGEPKRVSLKGEVYDLPAEFPIALAVYWSEGEFYKAVATLFGENADQVIPFLSESLITGIAREVYGLALPESSASSTSSNTTGKPARPTSKPSTGSTSDESSTQAPEGSSV